MTTEEPKSMLDTQSVCRPSAELKMDAKVPKRKKGKAAERASVTLKLPKFDDPHEEADFMMHTFKVSLCTRRRRHTWSGCPYAHLGETARRRDPRTHCAVPCPEMKQGQKCPRGDRCPYSHHDFEYWLHPTRYRTVMCNKGEACDRGLCFFAHGDRELRNTSSQDPTSDRAPQEPNSENKDGMEISMQLDQDDNHVAHASELASGKSSETLERSSTCSQDELARAYIKPKNFPSFDAAHPPHSHPAAQPPPPPRRRNQSWAQHMPPNVPAPPSTDAPDNLASFQIRSLLANAMRHSGNGASAAVGGVAGHGHGHGHGHAAHMRGGDPMASRSTMSFNSHGSGSPLSQTSTQTSLKAMGSPWDEGAEFMGPGWGHGKGLSHQDSLLARRQSAPTVMAYQQQFGDALRWLGSSDLPSQPEEDDGMHMMITPRTPNAEHLSPNLLDRKSVDNRVNMLALGSAGYHTAFTGQTLGLTEISMPLMSGPMGPMGPMYPEALAQVQAQLQAKAEVQAQQQQMRQYEELLAGGIFERNNSGWGAIQSPLQMEGIGLGSQPSSILWTGSDITAEDFLNTTMGSASSSGTSTGPRP